MSRKVLLMILDGWGIAKNETVSALDHANTPYIKSLYKKYPHSKLEASGLAVGLPAGQMAPAPVGAGRGGVQTYCLLSGLSLKESDLNINTFY